MKKVIPFYAIAVAVGIIIALCTFNISAPSDADRQYFCDYKNISFYLSIDVQDANGDKLYNINGEVFAAYEDDLAMMDNGGAVLRHTNDIYNLITQNEHVIYCDDELLYKCDGKLKIFADSYNVYNSDGKKIAYVDFNMFDTAGVMKDTNGKIIARYDSAWTRKDYVVSIYDGCEIDDESVLMIFASYVSDKRADSE